ncbi:hypothetical protein Tco_0227460 [Tanacetum coccineum]
MGMYCDTTGAIVLANEPRIQNGAKHYKRKVHYLREVIADNDINLLKHTNDNIADPFTKALPCTKHTGYTRSIGLCPASSLMMCLPNSNVIHVLWILDYPKPTRVHLDGWTSLANLASDCITCPQT